MPPKSRDELRKRERTLRRAYEIVAETDRPFPAKLDDLFDLVCETVETDYATLSRVHEDAGEYIFERLFAPPDADLQSGDRASLATLPNCAHVVETHETLVLEDVEAQAPALADPEWGIACYLGAPVVVEGEVYGTFCFFDLSPRDEAFSDWEVTFVELLASWVSYELDRQRHVDRVAALNELNDTVRGVATAVIDRSTRAEMEAAACESLADAESYEFAWIGEADPDTGDVRVRTAAGVEGVLDGVDLSVTDGETLPPPARTLQTGETQTRQNARVEAATEAWRDHAVTFGYRASASVPVTRAGAVTGVLTVHTQRPHAFTGEEETAMADLGELLGHAVAAAERKRALTSDTMVELTLRVQDALAERGVTDPPRETVLLHDLVEVDDGAVIAFGATSEDRLSTLSALCDDLSGCETVERTESTGDDVAFEVRFSALPLVTRVASLGGRVDQLLFDGGDIRATIYLPPDVDVRRVVDVVEESYPGGELVSKRETTRPDDVPGRVGQAVVEELTDKQLETLRTAYFAGYFERPRQTTGADLGDRLDVSNATVSQHLRVAQRKVFAALFDDEPGS